MTIVDARVVGGGVDTHADSHVAAALDHLGGVLGIESFETTEAGYRKLLGWLEGFGTVTRIGVEGTGSYGAGLARFLHDHHIDVVEVDRPNRQLRHRRGKSDPTDAIAAARAALSGEAAGRPKWRNGPMEQMRVLLVARRSARDQRIQTLNQIRHLVFTAPSVIRDRFIGRPQTSMLTEMARMRPRESSLDPALEMAVDDGRLTRSPCRRIALPRIEQSEKRFLSIDEVEHLAETIPPRYRVFVLTGAYTGLRPGELAALRTDRLDISRRQLRIEEPIKTPAARRTVSFSPFLAVELTRHLDTYPGDKNLIFTAPEGGPLDLRVFRRRVWYPAVRESVGEPMRPHDLRHTQVALLIAAGEDPYVISQRLGHASIRTTYDIYGHLFEGRDRQAADALEAARARSLADSPRTLGRSEGPSLGL